jgi:hypothetical protein
MLFTNVTLIISLLITYFLLAEDFFN